MPSRDDAARAMRGGRAAGQSCNAGRAATGETWRSVSASPIDREHPETAGGQKAEAMLAGDGRHALTFES